MQPIQSLVNSANDADEILPGLWLGNAKSSMDDIFIRKNKIEVVFNCTKNLGFSPNIITKYRIPLDDNLEKEEIRNMALWSSEICFKLMKEYNTGKNILVHCMAGMQRSAATVALLLIVIKHYKAEDAIQFIKSKRQIAFYPSANFGSAIRHFSETYYNEIYPKMKNIMNTR
jgi:hypothetical protein